MNIKRAKEEIKNSIEAYLMKDEYGEYMVPAIRQRPLLLMGPPGIGKTQIMEQVAMECEVSLVAYTITHHTRQSAVGLPFIKERTYGGKPYSITEYTMSEIIASVYEKIEKTGVQEGILFIDEINCVSETLAPTMLQFLQCKTFGNQKVPEGWVIVAAGNPPEYNKSVRDFDIVTLDRIKKIDVEENFEVWKEYAWKEGIHPAVITYLELKKDNFYKIETTVDGKLFATARGWEDLSNLIQVYEKLGKTVDREVVFQYIQHWKIAKDFANYLELYGKYRKDYGIEHILEGKVAFETYEKLKFAAFDERLSVIGLLSAKLSELFKRSWLEDSYVTRLYQALTEYRDGSELEEVWNRAAEELEMKKKTEQLTRAYERTLKRVMQTLEGYVREQKGSHLSKDEMMEKVRALFSQETERRSKEIDGASRALTHAFDFLEKAFGESQEMVVFITDLNTNYFSAWFIAENGSDQYYKYNKGLLFEERHAQILQQMDEIELNL